MKKVFLVLRGCAYEGWDVVGAFLEKEKAQTYIDENFDAKEVPQLEYPSRREDGCCIEAWDVL